MAILEWALWLDAEDFPLIDGFTRLRVARLPGIDSDPILRVFFEIEDGTVTILAVEAVDP